jgi:hypothetical protein
MYILNGLDFDEVEKVAERGSCDQMLRKFKAWYQTNARLMKTVSVDEFRRLNDMLIVKAIQGNVEMEYKLMDLVHLCGATVDSVHAGRTHLSRALSQGQLETAQALIGAGADVNHPATVRWMDYLQ